MLKGVYMQDKKIYILEFFDGYNFYKYRVNAGDEKKARQIAKTAYYDKHKKKAQLNIIKTS